MAQFSALFTVLLLVTVSNPIVCPNSKMYTERRDRAPHIQSDEHSPQHLDETVGLGLGSSRSRKAQLSSAFPTQTHFKTKDEEINERIESIFDTRFGPGLHLFKNTAPMGNPPNFYPYTDYMHGDQPQPQTQTPLSSTSTSSSPSASKIPLSSTLSSSSSNESGFFKVQRSPTGKLNLVYNNGYLQPEDVDSSSHTVTIRNSSKGNGQKTERTNSENSSDRQQDPASGGSNRNSNKPSPIQFPTEEPSKEDYNYSVNIEDCVEKDGEENGKPFCTNLRNYPKRSHLEQIIKKKFSNLELFFGEDLVLPQNISQRMNNEPNEEFLCKSRTRVIYPEAGLNKDYNWLVIVNIPNYKQGIRIEECINEGSTCGESNGLMLPNHYTATCKQSYIYRSLVAYTNETVIRDQFKMPSCCKCVLRTG